MFKKKLLFIIAFVLLVIGTSSFVYFKVQESNSDNQQTVDEAIYSNDNKIENEQGNQDLSNDTTQPRYPSTVGVIFKFRDDYSIGNEIPIRAFTIPTKPDESFQLSTAYQSYFSPKDDSSQKIMELTGGGAAFSDIYQKPFEANENWKSIVVQIGDFAQDECGDDIDIAYLLSNEKVSVLFFDNTPVKQIVNDSQCPRKPENFISEKAEADFARSKSTGTFCNERATCIQKYFSNTVNKEKLNSTFLNVVRDLKIE